MFVFAEKLKMLMEFIEMLSLVDKFITLVDRIFWIKVV